MTTRILCAALSLVAVAACARWRFDPAPVRPLPAATGEPGECEPAEYTVAAASSYDLDLRVIVDDEGRPLSVTVARGHDARSNDLALDLGRHVFACAHPLTAQAQRVIPSWLVHFRPMQPAQPVDPAVCKRPLKYPPEARSRELEGSVRVSVALDESGSVRRAWTHQVDTMGFVEAAIDTAEKCRFAPAIADGKPVATVVRHDVDFWLNR